VKNKVLATMFLIGICLACSPALYACQSCIAKGNQPPRCHRWETLSSSLPAMR
jgi:hypothetical protein